MLRVRNDGDYGKRWTTGAKCSPGSLRPAFVWTVMCTIRPPSRRSAIKIRSSSRRRDDDRIVKLPSRLAVMGVMDNSIVVSPSSTFHNSADVSPITGRYDTSASCNRHCCNYEAEVSYLSLQLDRRPALIAPFPWSWQAHGTGIGTLSV